MKVQAENFLLNGHIIGLSKVGVTLQNSIKHSGSERVKGIRILESGKLLLVESGIVGFGIRNTAQGIRNPTMIVIRRIQVPL